MRKDRTMKRDLHLTPISAQGAGRDVFGELQFESPFAIKMISSLSRNEDDDDDDDWEVIPQSR